MKPGKKLFLVLFSYLVSPVLAGDLRLNAKNMFNQSHANIGLENITENSNVNFVKKLVSKLLRNYTKEIIFTKPVVIHFDVLLIQVKNTIEREGVLESVVALFMDWKDHRLQWNPDEYSNLTFISLTTSQVWVPDIAMTNSADHPYSISRDHRFPVRVTYDGSLKYVPTGTARSWCGLKLLSFPFDIQKCALEFESWSFNSSTLTFDGKSNLLVDDTFASMQFQMCDHRATTRQHTYKFGGAIGETFTRVQFDFTVKRKSTFYVVNLIFPILTLSLVQSLNFLIPSSNVMTDRLLFSSTNLLTMVVYQNIFTEQLPKTSDAITALSQYVISLIVLATVGICETIIIERLCSRTIRRPPFILIRLLRLAPVLCYDKAADPKRKLSLCPQMTVEKSIRRVVFEPNIPEEDSTEITEKPMTTRQSSIGTDFNETKIAGNVPKQPYQLEGCTFDRTDTLICRKGSNCRICSYKTFLLTGKVRSKNLEQANTSQGKQKKQVDVPISASTSTTRKDKEYRRWLKTDPALLWTELTYKLDCITFSLCLVIALTTPVVMFLSLAVINKIDTVCTSSDDVH